MARPQPRLAPATRAGRRARGRRGPARRLRLEHVAADPGGQRRPPPERLRRRPELGRRGRLHEHEDRGRRRRAGPRRPARHRQPTAPADADEQASRPWPPEPRPSASQNASSERDDHRTVIHPDADRTTTTNTTPPPTPRLPTRALQTDRHERPSRRTPTRTPTDTNTDPSNDGPRARRACRPASVERQAPGTPTRAVGSLGRHTWRWQLTAQQIAGRYRLEGRLGSGGMSTVQLAFDTRLERHVAVKLLAEHLAEDPTFVSRFQREAMAAARLIHPNIVQVFDSGLDQRIGSALHRDGVHRGPVVRRDPPRPRLARSRGGAADHPRIVRGARLRPPQGRRPPRRQTREPPPRQRRRGQARRLRDRQGDRAGEHHPGRLGTRDGCLPRARNRVGARTPARRPTSTRSGSSPTSCSPAASPTRGLH